MTLTPVSLEIPSESFQKLQDATEFWPANMLYMWKDWDVVNLSGKHHSAKVHSVKISQCDERNTLSTSRSLYSFSGFMDLVRIHRSSINRQRRKMRFTAGYQHRKRLLLEEVDRVKSNPGWYSTIKSFWRKTKTPCCFWRDDESFFRVETSIDSMGPVKVFFFFLGWGGGDHVSSELTRSQYSQ